jgi:hypothetical protein
MTNAWKIRFAVILSLALCSCATQRELAPGEAGVSGVAFASANGQGVRLAASGRTEPVLYVSNGEKVLMFSLRGGHARLGTITDGVRRPQQLAVDSAGTLYVANEAGTVTIYPAGKVHPALTLSSGLSAPLCVAVDAAGTVYAGDFHGQIVEYPAGQTVPSLVIPPLQNLTGYGLPYSETISRNGHLFVSYDLPDESYVTEYAPGSTAPISTGITFRYILGIVFDQSGRLIVGAIKDTHYTRHGIYVYKLHPLHLERVFNHELNPYALAFNPEGRLYVGDPFRVGLSFYDYATGKLLDSIDVLGITGLAVSPARQN